MKRIVRLTESDLTRIVRRVISEQKKPAASDYIVKETQTGGLANHNFFAITSYGSPVAIKDYKGKGLKAFKITVNTVKYFNSGGTWEKTGTPSITLEHRCGAKSNLFAPDFNGGLQATDTGSAGYVSKIGGALETKSNTYCKSVGDPNQGSMYAG